MAKARVHDVEDDPKFPVKAVVGTVVAVGSWLVSSNVLDQPWSGIVTAVLTFLSVYVPTNPKVRKHG